MIMAGQRATTVIQLHQGISNTTAVCLEYFLYLSVDELHTIVYCYIQHCGMSIKQVVTYTLSCFLNSHVFFLK